MRGLHSTYWPVRPALRAARCTRKEGGMAGALVGAAGVERAEWEEVGAAGILSEGTIGGYEGDRVVNWG